MVSECGDNYIFISYAHKDSPKVLPIVETLTEHGFNVWYDAGIEAGTEWPEYIEEHLKNAGVVLVFMSPNAVESKNCRNEINFALELDKDILVVYLEETALVKGMRLQLNSTQSLFRKNHTSNETFIRELVNAKILQKCLTNSGDKEFIPTKQTIKYSTNETKISNVCSIGTNDEYDVWPSGNYSETINRDEFRVVFFHIKLLKTFGFSGTINNKYEIYNSENNLIYQDESTLNIEADYDRISTGWILKGVNGSFIPSGEYRFVCSINGSQPFTYFFTVTSDKDNKTANSHKKSFITKLTELFK